MNNKNDVLKNFKKMIVNSWTYKKMTAEEQIRLFETFDNIQTEKALKGTYSHRWEILQAIYSGYLMALGYSWNWREDEDQPF